MKNFLYTAMMSEVASKIGTVTQDKLDYYAENAEKIQKELLKKLMKRNKNTVYGKKNNFDKVNTVEDYQNIVPLSKYEDYDEYIYRMTEGEKNLITTSPIVRYAESSGSTGRPKLIPISRDAMRVCYNYGFNATVGAANKYFKKQGRRFPTQKGLLTVEVVTHKLPCGKTSSDISVLPILMLKPFVKYFTTSPKEIVFPEKDENTDMHYLKLLFALSDPDVTYMGTIFITMIESMFQYLEKNWVMLVEDIKNGTLNNSISVPKKLRKKLEKKLKPMPERAEFLREEFEKGFDTPIVPRIWKRAEWLYGMGTGSLALYSKKLRRYIGENMALHYLGYAASEGVMAVPSELNRYDFVMLPQNGFYEFLPVDAPDNTRPLTISELKVGKEYEVIVTNTSGLYRYRIEDVVKVTGYYKQSPTVTFMYRLNQVANINDEKISQRAFDLLMEDVSNHFNVDFEGYSIYANRNISPARYEIIAEPKSNVNVSERKSFAKRFQEELCRSNPLVYPQIKNGSLGNVEFYFLKKGTYEAYREHRKNNGARMNQQKAVKIINNDEKYDFFYQNLV